MRISVERPNVHANVAPGLPYMARWTRDRRWRDNPACHPTFYRNELDVMDEHAVDWTPYTAGIVQDLPPICLDEEQTWYARTPIICLQSVAMHYPDRAMRQFGLHQHIPDLVEHIFPQGWNRDLYKAYVARWDHRLDHVQAERIPRISIEQYYSWYWHITRRFVLKESSTRLPKYATQGPVERDLVQRLYMISNEIDDVLTDPANEDRVKGKYLNIKEIIKSLLDRHKLERPPTYMSRPPQAFGRNYQRRRFRGTGGPSQGSQPGQKMVEAGPS